MTVRCGGQTGICPPSSAAHSRLGLSFFFSFFFLSFFFLFFFFFLLKSGSSRQQADPAGYAPPTRAGAGGLAVPRTAAPAHRHATPAHRSTRCVSTSADISSRVPIDTTPRRPATSGPWPTRRSFQPKTQHRTTRTDHIFRPGRIDNHPPTRAHGCQASSTIDPSPPIDT